MKFAITITLLLFSGILAFAHGEDKAGPHGGHIKMPANFHTELLADKDGSFHIYLLDLQFQNPTVIDSEIVAYTVVGKKKTNLQCKPMGETHFQCLGTKENFKKGSLVIKAKRAGTWASMLATYTFPLKDFDTANTSAKEDHSQHR